MKTYENVPVLLDGKLVFATSASVDDSFPFSSSYRGYGAHALNASGAYESGRKSSNISISYLGNGDNAFLPLESTGIQYLGIELDGKLYSGLTTSFQASAEPLTPISISASFMSFSEPVERSGSATIESTERVYHGGGTVLALPSISVDPLTFSLSMSQSFQPIYRVGDSALAGLTRTDGSFSLSVRSDEPINEESYPCGDDVTATITFADVCGTNPFEKQIANLKMTARRTEVNEGDILAYSAEYVKYF